MLVIRDKASNKAMIRLRSSAQNGFTIVELACVLVITAILATFAVATFSGMDETADASLVQSVQTSLQAVISQGSTRLDTAPTALNPANVINAVCSAGNAGCGNQYTINSGGGAGYTVNFVQSGRGAVYDVNANGDVGINTLNGFSRFSIGANGTIVKN
ncbi:MAG: type II secretion system GspH family protein [Vampirovibrio sp.]|nr:type II secretion system GspH family protein [Vampirovibrio sp.]